MKNLIYFIAFGAFIFGNLQADELISDEMEVIDRMIRITENQLVLQKQMRELMIELRITKELFMKEESSKKYASDLVQTAYCLWNMIMDNHMEHLFTADYMEDLHFFSSIAAKNTIKRP